MWDPTLWLWLGCWGCGMFCSCPAGFEQGEPERVALRDMFSEGDVSGSVPCFCKRDVRGFSLIISPGPPHILYQGVEGVKGSFLLKELSQAAIHSHNSMERYPTKLEFLADVHLKLAFFMTVFL